MSEVVVMTGGGSGGHLTPIISVAEALKAQRPHTKIVYIGQKGDGLGDIMKDNPLFDAVYTVQAGKFRRYHGEGWKQILDVVTMAKNTRDAVKVVIGFFQSWRLLRKLRPKVIFCKGGFVGVPVCLAAATQRTPYITHDSDSIPGLANRIIARWAKIHAVGMAKELYPYPQNKTITVGVPIQKQFKPVTADVKAAAREKLALTKQAQVLFVIGGGQGAVRINRGVTSVAKELFAAVPHLHILHVAGRGNETATLEAYQEVLGENELQRIQIFGFSQDIARMGAAADVVITRAGATNMAEFAQQGKACIIVPSPFLTGGHQLKNASVYYKAEAAVVLLEADLPTLPVQVKELMDHPARRSELGEHLRQFAMPKAAESLAQLLVTMLEGH